MIRADRQSPFQRINYISLSVEPKLFSARLGMTDHRRPRTGPRKTQSPSAIATMRLRAGMTQDELAEALDTTQVTVYRWESGQLPSIDKLRQIAQALNCFVQDLLPADCFDERKTIIAEQLTGWPEHHAAKLRAIVQQIAARDPSEANYVLSAAEALLNMEVTPAQGAASSSRKLA